MMNNLDDIKKMQNIHYERHNKSPKDVIAQAEIELEHLAVSNLLREKDPVYGEENRQAKQQLKSFLSTYTKDLLQSVDAEIKEIIFDAIGSKNRILEGLDELFNNIQKE